MHRLRNPAGLGVGENNFPFNFDQMAFWYKNESIRGVADDAVISSWADSSAFSVIIEQTVNGNRPIKKASIFGSLPAARFDGTDDYMDRTSTFPMTSMTVLVALKNLSGSSDKKGVVTGPTDGSGFFITGSTLKQKLIGVSGNVESDAYSGSIGDARLWGYATDGTNHKHYSNGAVVTSHSGSVGQMDIYRVGGWTGSPATDFLNGDIGEILVYYNRKLDADVLSLYTNYFKPKFGLP